VVEVTVEQLLEQEGLAELIRFLVMLQMQLHQLVEAEGVVMFLRQTLL
jgi:hypothetical protein